MIFKTLIDPYDEKSWPINQPDQKFKKRIP